MKLERLSNNNQHLFADAFALYESAFPEEERRDAAEQKRVMGKEDYHFDLIMEGDECLGVMLYWETERFLYLEHFTTYPAVRGKGLGAAALGLLKAKGKTVLLEIEDPVDEMTCRRFGFYQRNGFVMTPHYHIQAKYHLGDEDLMLKILSYPHELTVAEYLEFQDYMTKEVGILPRLNDEITLRKMQAEDDRLQVAKLIYLSDAYIYPNWFSTMEEGQRVIAAMTALPTLYHQDNITLAVTKDGFIAGAAVACDSPVVMDENYLYEAFALADVPCDREKTHEIYLAYYAKMNDPEGYYLANIATDPAFRKRGIGAALTAELIKDKPLCHLECVKANIGAWRVYQRLGFTIVEEYPGVFDVPCYKMIRR